MGERRRQAGFAIALAAIVAGVVARAWPRSPLWLDEAQSVAFARLPLLDIPGALRTDGAPPLYYLLLHGWMELFGEGDFALRAMSVLLSIAAIGLFWSAVRRLTDARTATLAAVMMAVNPFGIRYAAETRMYALVVAEVCAGLLVLPAALERPTTRRLAGVAAVTAALLYTHYWAMYLLVAVAVVTAVGWWRARRTARRGAWFRVAVALVAGGVLWLPWLPSFLYQAEHTATPWTQPPVPLEVFDILLVQAGGHSRPAVALACILIAALLLALLPDLRRWPDRRWSGVVGRRPPFTLALAAVVGLTAVIAVAGAIRSGSALAGRYTSVLFPPLILTVAVGLARLRSRSTAVFAVVAMTALSSVLVVREIRSERTPAGRIASVLAARAVPGDVVAFCPDQLGPAVTRELERSGVLGPTKSALQLGTYPDWSPPSRVDWVDYTERFATSVPSTFAEQADRRAEGGTVWLVWSDRYPPTEPSCRALRYALARLRPDVTQHVLDDPGRNLDHAALLSFPTAAAP